MDNREPTAPTDAATAPAAGTAPATDTARTDVARTDGAGATETTVYAASTSAAVVPSGAAAQPGPGTSGEESREAGLLDNLRETISSAAGSLLSRGEELTQTARMKMEVMQYGRDLESLYARLGRAYHHRSAPEILALIESEIQQVERDIQVRENQLAAHDVSQEARLARREQERKQLDIRFPEPTAPATAGVIEAEARVPARDIPVATEKRDTFFGLDKGGVDRQTTVAGGNVPFVTDREDERDVPDEAYDPTSEVDRGALQDAEDRRR